MSLSGIGSIVATPSVTRVTSVGAGTVGGGGSSYTLGATSAGAYIAQGGGTPGGGSLIKKMIAGGVVGAGIGFGATFLSPIGRLITNFLPGGPIAGKAIVIAAGAGIGALGGLALHLIGKRRQNLAMQAQAAAAGPNAMQPTTAAAGGTILRSGARGPAATKLQKDLHTLGIYQGKLTGTFDGATQAAVRKYEVLKGVQPTGQGSPDVRAAVSQDVALIAQNV